MIKVVINGVEILEGQTVETTEDGMTYDNPSITGAKLINGVAIGTMDIGSAVSDALTFTLLNPYKSSFDGDTVDFYISPSESDELSTKEKIENEIGEDTYDEAISGIENVNEVEEASEEEEDPTEEDLADAELTESEIDDIQYLFFEGESDEFTDENTDEAEEDTWRKAGRYYISSQKAVNGGVVLTCYDGFIKMHGMFIPTTRTATVQELYDDLRTQVLVNCGITIDSFDFDSEYNITVNWDFNCSYRQALGYFAGLVGGFATFDEEGTAGISFYSYTDNILLDSDLISFNENSTDEILIDGIRCSVSVDGLDGNIIEVGAGQSISFINPFVNETILDKTYTMYRGIRFSGASLAVKWDDSLIAGEFVRIFTEEEYKAYVGIGNAISEALEGEDISDLKRNINSLGKVILISSQIIEFSGGEAVSAISSICESETEKENRIEDPLNYKLRRSLEKSTEAQEKAGQALRDAEDANKLADEALTASGDAMQSADAAQKAATSAQEAVETVQSDVSSLNTTVANAEAAIEQAKQAAATADVKATEAQTSVVKAQEAADNAAKAAADAQTTAESAIASSQTAQNTADAAVTKATAAATEAAAAKADAQTAQNEIDTLGERLTTLSNTMSADYARKSDLTEVTANLETKISQNADSISLQASRITVIDETANNAASLAAEAQSLAEKAQADAAQSLADAEAAQKAADDAALSAQAAQNEADAAKAAADTAQSVADKAAEDLAAAEADLATVSGRVDATEQDISDAQAKVAQAQAAADKAKADAETATQKATAAQTAADTAASNAAAAQTAAENAAKDAESAQALAASAEEAAQQKAAEAAASAAAAQAAANNAASEAAQAQSKADQAAEDAATAVTNANDAADKAAKAQSDLAAAQAELTAVTNRVGATEEEIAEAQAAVTAAQKSADDANKAAATAQGIADTAVANAQTAQTAADEAKSKAQAAQAAADNAKAAADAAQADVNALAVRVTTAETSITNNAEAIKLAATKEEVATTLAGYSTTTEMNSIIEQKANSITSEVSSTYATKTENQTATDAAEEARTIAEQTANKFTWIVKSGTSSSDFTLTDRVAQLTAANINLNGLVEFSGLDATTQSKVNSAVSDAASAVETASQAQSTASAAVTTANSASSTASAASTAASEAKSTANTASTNASNAVTTANAAKTIANTAKSTADTAAADASSALIAANSVDSVIAAWCKDNDRTVIDGAKIYTGSITVDKLYVTDLKTIGATIGGFTIGDSAIYNGAASLAGADDSVYLGLDGISCGTKFKVDKKGVLSTADIKMEKTDTESGITSTFGTYISSPETWTGSGLAVPEIKTKTKTVANGVTYSDTLTMYPFRISLEKYVTGTDNTWLRLEPTKLSMFSYITTNGFRVPELFIQPAGANSSSSVTIGQETHQIYSVEWTDDPYDYDDPLASCPHNMYPIKFNASTVTFNSAVAVKDQGLELYHATPYIDFHFGNSNADYTSRIIESASGTLNVQAKLQVKGTAVSLHGHTHNILHNTAANKDIKFIKDGNYCYFIPDNNGTSFAICGSTGNPWYKTYTERLEVTKERIVCKPTVETTTTYAANVYVGTTGIFTKYKASTSSKYIKHDIKELQDETINAERLYDVDVVQFKYNEGELPNGDQRYLKDLPGFIIENMAEVYPIAVDKQTEDSKGWSWNDHYIIPPMLKLIQEQHKVDIIHEERFNQTELRISALQNQLNEAMITIAKQQKQIDLLMAS